MPPAPPDDLALWLRRQGAGEALPWPSSVRFLADGEQPRGLDTSHLNDADRADPGTAAHVAAVLDTAALVTWAADDEGESTGYGYWHGPQGLPVEEAPIVLLDSEWQFDLTYGASLTEALCFEVGSYADEGFADLAAQCRALGVEITVDDPDDFEEPTASPTPADHCAVLEAQRLADG